MEEIKENPLNSDPIKGKTTLNPSVRKNLMTWLIIVAIVLGVSFLIKGGAARLGFFMNGDESLPDGYPYIGVIYVQGTIMDNQTDNFGLPIGYQHQWTLNEIDLLIDDDMNKGLVLFVDSPGGGVYESDELYFKLKEYKEMTGRPVYSAMGSMAASGGYYISAAADKIIANRNTWTGSIGVTIGTFYDISKFLEKNGISTTTITAGSNKAMGNMTQPMTEEQKEIFQALVDECYNQFTDIVATGRNMDIEKVRTIADGRIYTARQAMELGLIDAIGTKDEAISDMQQHYGLQSCDVIDLIYQDNSVLGKLFNSVMADIPTGDVSAVLKFVEGDGVSPILYKYEWQ